MIFVIILILCSILYYYIKKRIITPISQLTDFGSEIAKGNFSKSLLLDRDDELGKLSADFNNLMIQLKENISSIKAIIEFMPSIIIQLDTEGKIMEWNRMAEKLTGLAIDEAKNRSLKEIKPELAVYLWSIEKVIETEKPLSLYRVRIAGYETLVELKQLKPDLPVLMTSGLYSNELIENVKKAGASDFIEKPYSVIQLSKKVRSLFSNNS